MKISQLKQNQNGLTMIELLVALTVITVGLFAVWSLFLSNYNAEKDARNRVIAVNLAREGAEIIRNIRDSNWLKIAENESGVYWYSGILTGSNYDGDGAISSLFDGAKLDYTVNSIDDVDARLVRDADGFYVGWSTGPGYSNTPFSRLVETNPICCQDTTPKDFKCDTDPAGAFLPFDSQNLCDPNNDLIIGADVKATVKWQIESRTGSVEVEDQLFDWR